MAGSFFVINLYLVVMCDSYESARRLAEEEDEKAAKAVRRMRRFRILAGLDPDDEEVDSSSKDAAAASRSLGQRAVGAILSGGRAVVRGAGWLCPPHPTLQPKFGEGGKDNRKFELAMVGAILANTLVMAVEFYGTAATPAYLDALTYINYAFTFIFVGEMALKVSE